LGQRRGEGLLKFFKGCLIKLRHLDKSLSFFMSIFLACASSIDALSLFLAAKRSTTLGDNVAIISNLRSLVMRSLGGDAISGC
jgi:hypothetical protein